jgi:hypothetical protein
MRWASASDPRAIRSLADWALVTVQDGAVAVEFHQVPYWRIMSAVTSWRDSASPEAQADLDGLLDPALEYAEHQLEKRGEFFPFAVTVNADGEIAYVLPALEGARPRSLHVIAVLRDGFAQERDELRAVAIVAEVEFVSEGGDGIQVELEHAEGTAITLQLPYKKKRFGRGVELGELSASVGTRHTWLD